MLERTKVDLENFNSRIEMIRQCDSDLNQLNTQKNYQKEEIMLLKSKIRKIKLNIEIIRVSLQILATRELKVITEYYFENLSTRDIAIKLNLSIDRVSVARRNALKQLANCMYGHLKDFPFVLDLRDIP